MLVIYLYWCDPILIHMTGEMLVSSWARIELMTVHCHTLRTSAPKRSLTGLRDAEIPSRSWLETRMFDVHP